MANFSILKWSFHQVHDGASVVVRRGAPSKHCMFVEVGRLGALVLSSSFPIVGKYRGKKESSLSRLSRGCWVEFGGYGGWNGLKR